MRVCVLQDSDSYSDDDESHSQSHSHSRRRLARPTRPLTYKRRARILFKTLMDYMTEDGRQPIVAFIEKPAKREYPDYYEVKKRERERECVSERERERWEIVSKSDCFLLESSIVCVCVCVYVCVYVCLIR